MNLREKIGIVSDHGGFELKSKLVEYLQTKFEVQDEGVFNENPVDYPIVISSACRKLLDGEFSKMIALCGTGIGASIAANRVKGIRAALCHDEFTAEMSKKHNNANVLVLGGRILAKDLAIRIIEKWLTTSFEGGRHERRVLQLDELIQ